MAARWLKLSPAYRERTGIMAPSHVLRNAINAHIRDRLARDGAIRGRAELVTDNAKALEEQLEAATGERMAALEGIGEPDRGAPEKQQKALHVGGRETELGKDRDSGMSTDARQFPEPEPDRSKNRGRNMGFGL